jgi:transcriptional regulator with XRE-family HTH domain
MESAAKSIAKRFRLARERASLSIAEMAVRAGISEPCIWDLETYDNELMTVYSPADLYRFADILSVAPTELVGTETPDAHLSASELASAICEHCQVRRRTLEEFGHAAGWDICEAVGAPQLLLTDFSIDGIQDICRELDVDWRRFISGLSQKDQM